MVINWYGQSCFKIISGQEKDGRVNIVIDPFSESLGLKLPKMEADIVLMTHDHSNHNNFKAISGDPFVVSGPGEYEVKNIYLQGIHSWHDDKEGKDYGQNTIYTIEAEDLKVCHLGDLGQKELSPEQIDRIGQVDILIVPVGGTYTLSAKEAIRVMSQIEPSIVIPMHYWLPKLKVKIEGLDQFLKTIGVKGIIALPKLTVKKKDLLPEEAKIVILSP